MRLSPRTLGLLHKYALNPPMRPLVWLGLFRDYGFLETIGRRSRRRRRVLVAFERDGDAIWLVALHGRSAGYVRNIEDDPHVRVWLGRRWTEGTARVAPDDDAIARAIRSPHRLDRFWVRTFGADPISVRVELRGPGQSDSRRRRKLA